MHLPTLAPRRLTGAVAAACAAALIPVAALAATASTAVPAAAASIPACATGGLVVWISNVQGAAGTFYYTLNFTIAFDFAIAACLVASVASLLRGRKYIHGVDPEPAALPRRGTLREPDAMPARAAVHEPTTLPGPADLREPVRGL
jgi:hypothetical protein